MVQSDQVFELSGGPRDLTVPWLRMNMEKLFGSWRQTHLEQFSSFLWAWISHL